MTKTPMRISLAGGGSDFPKCFGEIGYGSVLSYAIDASVYVGVRLLNPTFHKEYRIEYSEVERPKVIGLVKNDVIRGALEYLDWDHPVQINVISDIPGQSGLGGSSAFCTGLVHALLKLRGETAEPEKLARLSNIIELEVLKKDMGIQDALPAAFGGLHKFEMQGIREIKWYRLKSPEIEKFIRENLVLIWTKKHRESRSVLTQQIKDIEDNVESYKMLRDCSDKTFEKLQSDSLDQKKIETIITQALRECHNIKAKVAPASLGRETFEIIGRLQNLDIRGYRVVGAGNGGFVLAVVGAEHWSRFVREFSDAIYFRPGLFHEGSTVQFLDF